MPSPQLTEFTAHLSTEAVLLNERDRIVRLCAYLTGDQSAAEDLAQEAMVEAWRTSVRLDDPAALSGWLTGCARNVCRRWLRARGRELSMRDDRALDIVEPADTHQDLELELERDDLATLLDRALALLPADTRDALVLHYIEQRSQAEIADQLNASENAISVRLHRGRIAMRKALEHPEIQPLSESFGLQVSDNAGWTETRIWCHGCGKRRLIARFVNDHTGFEITCPDCRLGYENIFDVSMSGAAFLFSGISSFKPAYTRASDFMSTMFRRFHDNGAAQCFGCGRDVPLHDGPPEELPDVFRPNYHGAHYVCPHCGNRSDSSIAGVLRTVPELNQFLKDHPRVQRLVDQEIERDGEPVVVSGYESLSGSDRIEIISTRHGFHPVSVITSGSRAS